MNEEEPAALSADLPAEGLAPGHRSGFVAVLGKPNAGKSTLMNAYLGQKVAIVSDKPQTTRNRLLGILTLERAAGDPADAQVIFMDTPGIHRPQHRLGEYLVETAVGVLPDADLIVWLVDVTREPGDEDRQIADILRRQRSVPIILAMNKGDLISGAPAEANAAAYQALGHLNDALVVSALQGMNLDRLLNSIVQHLPYGPRYFPEDQVTDQQLRFMAAELVREQVLRLLREEVPHSIAVVVQDFEERGAGMTYISANIYVERDTQKPIVLGRGGTMIKRIGQQARREIESLLETKVYLELWVKVKKGWRKRDDELRRMGYEPPR